ncbi:MFS transporter [Actinopolymorpha sp. B9G3]|uniref:MFS transporter n=1 Tax=Actinopolymorpha sp. B9G3 TaxID=3158970 RepID=UPI0032D98038
MFRSLRNRNYRYFAAGSLVANVGTWLQRVAQDWLVLQLTAGSGVALGITTGLQFLPFLLLAPFGGLIADRFAKRKVLQCTQLGMALAAAALAVLDLTGVVEVWHVYLLSFLFGVAGAIDHPARQAFVVEMVGKDDLPNAVGLNSASFNAARVIGPAMAGLLIMFVGTGWVILLNALSYGATIFALAKMRAGELHSPTPVPRKPGMLVDGLRYVRNRPDLVLVLAVVFFVGCFGLNFQLTSALMATETFGKGAGEYGILGSAMAIGAVIGALGAARRGSPRMRLVIYSAVIFGAMEIIAGLLPTYISFAVSMPLLGFVQLTLITATNAMMQLTVAPEMRGRVLALYGMVFIGSKPLGSPVLGWLGEVLGARWTLIGGGVASLLGTLLAGYVVLRWQRMKLRPHLRPRPYIEVVTAARPSASEPVRIPTPDAADASTETASTETGVPDVSAPDVPTPDVSAPDVPTPDVTTPEIPAQVRAADAGATTWSVSLPPTREGTDRDTVVRSAPRPVPHRPPAAAEGRMRLDGSTRDHDPKPGDVSTPGEKVSTCNQPAISRHSKPTPHDSSTWRTRDLPRRFRRARPGRSKTS